MSAYQSYPSPYSEVGQNAREATGLAKGKPRKGKGVKAELPSTRQINRAKLKGMRSHEFNPGANYAKEKRDTHTP